MEKIDRKKERKRGFLTFLGKKVKLIMSEIFPKTCLTYKKTSLQTKLAVDY